uniref:Secreted protein n=1 Tax=Haemonchus contortus TaxID=6289 RepID=A0A7I4YIL4_HAECO
MCGYVCVGLIVYVFNCVRVPVNACITFMYVCVYVCACVCVWCVGGWVGGWVVHLKQRNLPLSNQIPPVSKTTIPFADGLAWPVMRLLLCVAPQKFLTVL